LFATAYAQHRLARARLPDGGREREIAQTLDITERTVQRDWEKARPMLAEALR
jgi:hypothetical protein